MQEHTEHPVVLIHGMFGWGRKSPVFNLFPSYWPENVLFEVNPNHVIVEVGVASSDHDRACETFYQLKGGRVDYGEEHARAKDHERFGALYSSAQFPEWNEKNPIHLVGHSYGATTALELYQLLCKDYFNVGSNHKWVVSITSIAGPLSGTSLVHLMGLKLDQTVQYGGAGHILGVTCGFIFKLQQYFPWLKEIYDFRTPQWVKHLQWRKLLSEQHPFNVSKDNVYHSLSPYLRQRRNDELVHMNDVYLFSIVCKARDKMWPVYGALAGGIALVLALLHKVRSGASIRSIFIGFRNVPKTPLVIACLVLIKQLRNADLAHLPVFQFLVLLIRFNCRRTRPLYQGFDAEMWHHSDGVVNTYSMLYPRSLSRKMSRTPSQNSFGSSETLTRTESHHSLDLHQYSSDIERGRWYIFRVEKNHFCGTAGDKAAAELYKNLFRLFNHVS